MVTARAVDYHITGLSYRLQLFDVHRRTIHLWHPNKDFSQGLITWIMWNIIPIMGDTEAESTAPAVDGGDRGPRGVTISEN